jgi:glycerol-3-phosphate cytidylyltransferase
MKTGITCGTFDLLHVGHIAMFAEAKQHCDRLIVGVQTDPTVDRKDKNKPIQSTYERVVQIRACKYVDELFVYETEEDLYNYLAINKDLFDIRFVDENYKDVDFTGKDLGIPIFYNSRKHTYSSSELRNRVVCDYLNKMKG